MLAGDDGRRMCIVGARHLVHFNKRRSIMTSEGERKRVGGGEVNFPHGGVYARRSRKRERGKRQ